MREKPWQVINIMTNETVDWCETNLAAHLKWDGEPVSIIYRPGRKAKVKRVK